MNYLIKREALYLSPKPNQDTTKNWTEDILFAGVFTEEEIITLEVENWENVEIISMDHEFHVTMTHKLNELELKKIMCYEKLLKCDRNK